MYCVGFVMEFEEKIKIRAASVVIFTWIPHYNCSAILDRAEVLRPLR